MNSLSDRLYFCMSLIGFGAVLVLAPLLSHVYMVNKHRDRAWGDSGGEAIFTMAGTATFAVGALLIFLGLRWARHAFVPQQAAAVDASSANPALAATSSFRS